jgi:tetratricopeptide (TPR) repeat protein
LRLNPDLPEIKLAKAVAYYYLDRDYNKSLQILTELKTISPNMADLYAYSSYILRRQGKWEESIHDLKHAIELDPFNANYIDNLAFTYQILHEYDIEIELYKKGLRLIPDHKFFNYNLFIAIRNKTGDLQRSLKESGLKEEDVQFEFHYYTKRYKEAIEYLQKQNTLTSTQFQYIPITYQLALIHFLSGDTSLCKTYADSAIIHLKEKIRENPSDDRYYATLGKCYAMKGKVKEAINYGKKAVELKPNKEDIYLGIKKEEDLMEIYLLSGNYKIVLDKLEYLLSVPSWLSIGDLLIDPLYDKLRQLPGFQKIINSDQKQHE